MSYRSSKDFIFGAEIFIYKKREGGPQSYRKDGGHVSAGQSTLVCFEQCL